MRKRESALRNVLLLAMLLVIAGAFVALLPLLRSPGPMMPPESAEIAAKRLAPENAYKTLGAAVKLSPKLVVPQTPAVETAESTPMRAQAGDALDGLLDTQLPGAEVKFDPQGPSLEKMREALSQPYYLWPVDWNDPNCPLGEWRGGRPRMRRQDGLFGEQDEFMRATEFYAQLGRNSTSRAMTGIRGAADPARCFAYFLDAIDLALLLQQDGDHPLPSLQLLRDLVPFVYDIARAAPDATLSQASERIASLRSRIGSPRANADFLFRRIDRSRSRSLTQQGGDPDRVIESVFVSLRMRKLRQWIIAHRDEVNHSIELPYTEYRKWSSRQRGPYEQQHQPAHLSLFDALMSLVEAKAESALWLDCADVMIALERYRLKTGTYPETLDALVPDYLKSVPQDSFAEGKPLNYGRSEDNYRLYSVGENGVDNIGSAPPRTRVLGRSDDLMAHVPMTPSGKK